MVKHAKIRERISAGNLLAGEWATLRTERMLLTTLESLCTKLSSCFERDINYDWGWLECAYMDTHFLDIYTSLINRVSRSAPMDGGTDRAHTI